MPISNRRAVAAILLAAAAAATPGRGQTARKPARILADYSAAIEDLAASLSPAVVQIEVRARALVDRPEDRRAGFFAEQRSSGSGVIVDAAGFVVTNAHVVEGAREIDVSVVDLSKPDQREAHRHYPGRIAGVDRESDLAVLKIEAENLPTLPFVDSDTLRQGQVVLALGSPLGLQNTLTVGYISATSRQLRPDRPMTYVQTDAPINPGNSGGPLLDISGRIAGINTLILSQSGGSEGIGFAIPSNTARQVYEQIRREGRVHRGVIGVFSQDISPELSDALGIGHHPGVILADVVPHSAAEAAGLEPGDIVLALDGKPMTEGRQLMTAVFRRRVGEKVTLSIQRGQEKMEKTVVVTEKPNSPGGLLDLVNDAHLVRQLGILALTLDQKVTPLLPDLRRLAGVVVAAIPAELAGVNPGLQAGDVIYEFNAKPVRSLEELRAALAGKKSGEPIALLVEHEGRLGYVAFRAE